MLSFAEAAVSAGGSSAGKEADSHILGTCPTKEYESGTRIRSTRVTRGKEK